MPKRLSCVEKLLKGVISFLKEIASLANKSNTGLYRDRIYQILIERKKPKEAYPKGLVC